MSHKLTKRQLRSIKRITEHRGQHELRKEERAQRRLARAQQQERPPRRRDWIEDAEAAPSFEKIRRARTEEARAPAAPASAQPPGEAGTVIEVRSGDSLVAYRGVVLRATLPARARLVDPQTRSPLAVGDRVEIEPTGNGGARIVRLLPRRSALVRAVYDPSRRSAAHAGQVMAANIDQVFIVCSPAAPPFRARLIDRFLVAASRDGLPPVICLNKIDQGVPAEVAGWLAYYEQQGASVLRTSALRGDGIDELKRCFAGKISLLAGHSGVGKSSLLNAMAPGLHLKVRAVTEATAGQGKGRHTTASARLVPLSLPGTYVVDSPGIRAFGIRGMPPRELATHFVELARLAPDCAYHDCLHRGELGCVADDASRSDRFLRERLESYRAVLAEVS